LRANLRFANARKSTWSVVLCRRMFSIVRPSWLVDLNCAPEITRGAAELASRETPYSGTDAPKFTTSLNFNFAIDLSVSNLAGRVQII
jgi:hypothetical protein